MKGRCIGILSGNHFPAFEDGTTGDQVLARELDTKFLGVCSAIRLTFFVSSRKQAALDIFAHHGRGGGQTTGGRMLAVDKLQHVCEGDIYLMGDNHARGILPTGDKLRLQESGHGVFLSSRRAWIARTGGFLKGYEPDQRSYVVDRALPPSSLGWVEFEITPRREQKRYPDHRTDRITLDIRGKQ
jgi:hypothetical protein